MENQPLGVVIRENRTTYTYGIRKYAQKKDQDMKWKLCSIRFRQCMKNPPARVRNNICLLILECFPESMSDDHLWWDKNEFIDHCTDGSFHHFWLEDAKKDIITYLKYDPHEQVLWNICTTRSCRRQGFMRLLLDYFFSVISERPVSLYVLKKNPTAIRAYKKYGFRMVEEKSDRWRMSYGRHPSTSELRNSFVRFRL